VHGVAEVFVAGSTHVNLKNFAGLKADRSGTSQALHRLVIAKEEAIRADFA